jgi:hypothetical protein
VGIERVGALTARDILRGALTFKDPKTYLFFTRTPNGRRQAARFMGRLKERTRTPDTVASSNTTTSSLPRPWNSSGPELRTADAREKPPPGPQRSMGPGDVG